MNAKIKIYNKVNKIEKEFYLPLDIEEVEEFLTVKAANTSGYKIISVEDDYDFLLDINAKNDFYQDINKLIKLIENSNIDKKETCLKLLFHTKNNSDIFIIDLIENFEYIQNKYTINNHFSRPEDWAECNNDKYHFINIDNINDIVYNFDYDLRENYLRDISATVDLGEGLQDKLYTMDLEHILYKFREIGVLNILDIEGYLDWKNIVVNLRASMFYIDKFKGVIIIYNDQQKVSG